MKYISTRGGVSPMDFQDAVLMGLADDGGLIIPESIPDISMEIESLTGLSYIEFAKRILSLYISDIPEEDLSELIEQSYGPSFSREGDVAPLVSVGPVWIQELWHGPTLAFKDVALQFLGNMFEYALSARKQRLTILGATSGDTGSAAIHGVRGRNCVDIFMMHPDGRVSPVQKQQMTSVLESNVHNIAIDGSFDDCQEIMKTLAGDLEFKRKHNIGAVNSVNWARVLAQVVYYFYGALHVCKKAGQEAVAVSVPTGNFGNILAGWYAMKMGAPIKKLILATNENDILSRFFNDRDYSRGEVAHTINPSMDIQVASNFERYLYYRLGSDPRLLKEKMEGFASTGKLEFDNDCPDDLTFVARRCDKKASIEAISRYYREYGYLFDPHTAAGVVAAEDVELDGMPVICLSTAHPSKFPDAIVSAIGSSEPAVHPSIEALKGLETRCDHLPADTVAVREYMERVLE